MPRKEFEFDDDDWVEEDDDSFEMLICPSCTKAVHEDTQQCPHCGEWITPQYPQRPWKRVVWLGVVVLMLLLMIMVAVL